MWQRFTLYDLRVIGHYLGTLILFSALTMVVPLLTALVFQEWEPAARYLFAAGLALTAGALLRFLRIEPGRLSRRQALAVTGTAWIILALFASVPLYFSGHYATYLDALFDGVSGLTTTGATVIQDLNHLSNADNMLRFMMHLLGGLGLIVVALSIGLFGKRAGASLYTSEGRSEHVVPNVVQTTQFIAGITVEIVAVATVVIGSMCLVAGMEPSRAFLQALWLSISGFVTGGFAPMSQSIMYYHSAVIEFVLMVLMLLGSISFVLYAEVWKGRVGMFFRDIETRTMLLWIGVMTVVMTAALSAGPLFSDLPALLRRGLFMVVSAFTTTGFQVVTSNQLTTAFTSGAFLTLALIMAVGGSAGSTSGGIKFSRVGIIFKSMVATIKEALAPDSARVVVAYNHIGRRVLTPEIVKEAMTVFILFVVTYVIGALVGIAHGYEATQAIFESVAMTSNGGITTGLATSGMPMSLELFYIFQMWAGRLEFVTLLALVVEVAASFIPRRKETS
ncbi:TrkH family potassium uptake protein [Adlercreutzia faecimuris]|uniref:TrkH family potassium uptake protein n=1 Tax=Adlercreutzia faecimuris TaxID=2897341 RepID=A0ABS9WDL3_9ACTN|nr:potassium transporter TrkG [Adlercreutzia sp. JBNU-10]MCI2240957.1 TrkH family potassium uptake protein [Adlercreutzia sp. JBNU-10]